MQMSSLTAIVLCFTVFFKLKAYIQKNVLATLNLVPQKHMWILTNLRSSGSFPDSKQVCLATSKYRNDASVYHHFFEKGRISALDLTLFLELCNPCNIFFRFKLILCTHV